MPAHLAKRLLLIAAGEFALRLLHLPQTLFPSGFELAGSTVQRLTPEGGVR